MNEAKQKRLEKAGWKIGTAEEFFGVDELLREAVEVVEAALSELERIDTVKLAARGLDHDAGCVSRARRFLDIVIRSHRTP